MDSDITSVPWPPTTVPPADSSASVPVDEITEQDGDYAHEVDTWRTWTNGGTDTAYARAQDISWHKRVAS